MKSIYLETDGDRSPKDVYLCEDFGGGRIATMHGDNEREMVARAKEIVTACNSRLLANAAKIVDDAN
jgi:hypothetical protein